MVSVKDVLAARDRIRANVALTPCPLSEPFSDLCGAQIHFKLENLQRTGSFKERGAANKFALLTPAERKQGVVAASAGNHAQAVAYNAQRMGIHATIVMPEVAPLSKVVATRKFGAEIVLHGLSYDDAYAKARELEQKHGYVFIHAFDDDAIIAGQGTAALEILEQVPDLEVLVASIGGGGFLGGMALVMKEMKPSVRVIGVESSLFPKMRAALDAGGPVLIPAATTLADGIAVKRAGEKTLPLFRKCVDEIVGVDDEEVANAILSLIEREKTVAEGAGAAPAAALLHHKVKGLTPRTKVVCAVSGGNIDVNVIARIIERGLVKEGRRVMLSVRVPDRPGMLAGVLAAVAAERANVLEVVHNRAFLSGAVGDTEIALTLETRGPEHIEELTRALTAKGYAVVRR
ncbi:MAG: threonine ammonia-lyase [Myxococcales bacterium]|nr:threonine ammonia-lyase [Myxococcales bacterium]